MQLNEVKLGLVFDQSLRLTTMAMSDVTINEILEPMTARASKLADILRLALEETFSGSRFSVAAMGDDTAQNAVIRRDRLRLSVERELRASATRSNPRCDHIHCCGRD